jgi:hypothetical protein
MLLVQGRGEMSVLPAVTAVLLQLYLQLLQYCTAVLNNNLSSTLYHNAVQYFPTDSTLTKYIHVFYPFH